MHASDLELRRALEVVLRDSADPQERHEATVLLSEFQKSAGAAQTCMRWLDAGQRTPFALAMFAAATLRRHHCTMDIFDGLAQYMQASVHELAVLRQLCHAMASLVVRFGQDAKDWCSLCSRIPVPTGLEFLTVLAESFDVHRSTSGGFGAGPDAESSRLVLQWLSSCLESVLGSSQGVSGVAAQPLLRGLCRAYGAWMRLGILYQVPGGSSQELLLFCLRQAQAPGSVVFEAACEALMCVIDHAPDAVLQAIKPAMAEMGEAIAATAAEDPEAGRLQCWCFCSYVCLAAAQAGSAPALQSSDERRLLLLLQRAALLPPHLHAVSEPALDALTEVLEGWEEGMQLPAREPALAEMETSDSGRDPIPAWEPAGELPRQLLLEPRPFLQQLLANTRLPASPWSPVRDSDSCPDDDVQQLREHVLPFLETLACAQGFPGYLAMLLGGGAAAAVGGRSLDEKETLVFALAAAPPESWRCRCGRWRCGGEPPCVCNAAAHGLVAVLMEACAPGDAADTRLPLHQRSLAVLVARSARLLVAAAGACCGQEHEQLQVLLLALGGRLLDGLQHRAGRRACAYALWRLVLACRMQGVPLPPALWPQLECVLRWPSWPRAVLEPLVNSAHLLACSLPLGSLGAAAGELLAAQLATLPGAAARHAASPQDAGLRQQLCYRLLLLRLAMSPLPGGPLPAAALPVTPAAECSFCALSSCAADAADASLLAEPEAASGAAGGSLQDAAAVRSGPDGVRRMALQQFIRLWDTLSPNLLAGQVAVEAQRAAWDCCLTALKLDFQLCAERVLPSMLRCLVQGFQQCPLESSLLLKEVLEQGAAVLPASSPCWKAVVESLAAVMSLQPLLQLRLPGSPDQQPELAMAVNSLNSVTVRSWPMLLVCKEAQPLMEAGLAIACSGASGNHRPLALSSLSTLTAFLRAALLPPAIDAVLPAIPGQQLAHMPSPAPPPPKPPSPLHDVISRQSRQLVHALLANLSGQSNSQRARRAAAVLCDLALLQGFWSVRLQPSASEGLPQPQQGRELLIQHDMAWFLEAVQSLPPSMVHRWMLETVLVQWLPLLADTMQQGKSLLNDTFAAGVVVAPQALPAARQLVRQLQLLVRQHYPASPQASPRVSSGLY